MSGFRQGWLPFIEQALRRRFATAAQGLLAATAVQPGDLTGFATSSQGAKADTALQPAAIAQLANIRVRQAIQSAPVNGNGYADFLQFSGLTVSGKNISAENPLILAVTGVPESGGRPRDWVFPITSNPTWPNSANNATNFHFIRFDSSGNPTYITRTLAPNYGQVLPSSPSNGRFHYDIRHLGPPKVHNGSQWENQLEICVGESVASGGNVTSTASYAICGIYEGMFSGAGLAADTAYSQPANIGVPGDLQAHQLIARFVGTPTHGFQVGDLVDCSNSNWETSTSGTSSHIIYPNRKSPIFKTISDAFGYNIGPSSVAEYLFWTSFDARMRVWRNF